MKSGVLTLTKNEEYVLEIDAMGSEGEGVGRVDGFAVFVPFALTGETVRVKIVKMLKNYAHARLEEVITPSPSRLVPECESFYKCGGCNFWHVDYDFEFQYKTQKVKDAIKRIGKSDAGVCEIIGVKRQYHYRNKAQFPVTPEGIGFFAPRSHRLVPMNNCLIQNQINEKMICALKKFMEKYGVLPYDEKTHTGDIRHLYTRVAENTGEVMVCIVTRQKKLLHSERLVEILLQADKNIVSIVQNVNPDKTNAVLGEREILLWGKPYIKDKIEDLYFRISPKSFYQVNSDQTKILYDEVVKAGNFTGNERVLDLYCGAGTISLYIARHVKEVKGVEVVARAVENARENAILNGIDNAVFVEGRAEDIAPDLSLYDVVIVDPPRKGCNEKLLQAMLAISPKKIIYVSCNPATLARDIKILEDGGYKTEWIQPVDMFPRTPHVETVVLITRVKE
ncbi:MAG: 23S rRNA (uracil-C(5))-methyltransferase RlmCD [Firmicutes bacterium ADurb.Bin193]|nr:MAG: 23S rRNA (uracil-C(5))-methyltransferase RlmCD [Firmicutes bacterium ADurb.Bin193]